MQNFRGRTRGEWIALALFALVVGCQVFVPPIVGLADNGDFDRVLGVFGVGAPADDQYHFVHLKYDYAPQRYVGRNAISTEQALAGLAIVLNPPFNRRHAFDIRFLGAVHTALYILAFYLLQPLLRGLPTITRVALYAAILAVFGDVMYVSWMTTAYTDTSALLFLLLSAVLCLRALAWKRRADQIGFIAAAALFTASKTVHSPLGLAMAGLLLIGGSSLGGSSFGGRILRGVGAALIVAAMVVTWMFLPADYTATGMYSVLFYELLPYSNDVGRDLQQLGLDDSYRRCIGTYAYQEGNPFQDPQFVQEFSKRASHVRLSLFLLRHPTLTYRGIRYSLDFAGRQRPPMGNFLRKAGFPASTESRSFAWWSSLKRRTFERQGTLYFAYFLGLCALLCGALWWRRRGLFAAGACLCLMALMNLGITAFGDALEVARHFFLFNALTDMILICALAALLPVSRATNAT